ncbi:restriction endonuclease subunit S [Yoonia maritima]|uniref:restriction endonuclease subunit S n=1 Tax=Yoonia maritima TaxID=1435347 RepID=UPI0037350767
MTGAGQAKYRPYPAYKPSGLEWLGDIPEGWEMIQSRRLFSQRKERARPDDEQLTASQKYGIIYQKEFMKIESQRVVQVITGSEILKHVEADDFVISMRSFQGGLEWCKYAGCVSSAYVGVIPQKHVVPAFFSYFFKCKQYIQALQSTSNLVRDGQALRFDNFAQVSLPIVPEQEQTKIAAFLDYETAKIDALIAKQQRLIALLEEKRQAVISHAVTKGLDPTAPLRPSGIDWLGDVPAHWEVKRLKYLGNAWNGLTYSPDDVVAEGDGTLVLRSSNIQNAKLAFNDNVYVKGVIPKKACVIEGDLLICSRNGSRALIGKNAQITADLEGAAFGAFMCIFRSEMNAYLSAVLNSSLFEFQSGTFLTSTINQLTTGNLLSFEIPLPPEKERGEIVKFLGQQVAKFNELLDKAQSAITLLKERRTALISAAVTGKIDLRDWQAPAAATDTTQDKEAMA